MMTDESERTEEAGSGARLRAIVSEPHLAPGLLWVFAVLVFSNALLILLRQPLEYWVESQRAFSETALLQPFIAAGPVLFLAATVLYVVAVGFVLRKLTFSPALVLWLVVCFIHWSSTFAWSNCPNVFLTSSTECLTVNFVGSLITAGLVGMALAQSLHAGRAAVPKWLPRLAFAVLLLWFVLLTSAVVQGSRLPESGWVPVAAAEHPPGRIDGRVAYDSGRQRAVMFGGAIDFRNGDYVRVNDTWEWDGENWIEMTPATSPEPRISHALAYDEARQVTVLFGGAGENGVFNDTWVWDGEEWRQRDSAYMPPRCCHRMFYHPQRERVIMFGGVSGGTPQHFYYDAWEWDGEYWVSYNPESGYIQASNFDVAYDRARQFAVVQLGGPPYGGTWFWLEQEWLPFMGDSQPPQRLTFELAYDPMARDTVLFGGSTDEQFFDDTWLFNGTNWREFESDRPPEARRGFSLFFDEVRQRVMLFGGFDGSNYRSDMWELVRPDS